MSGAGRPEHTDRPLPFGVDAKKDGTLRDNRCRPEKFVSGLSGPAAVMIAGKNAPLGRLHELNELLHLGKVRKLRLGTRNGVGHAQSLTEEDVVKALDRTDRLGREAVAPQPHNVESADPAVGK